MGLNPFKRYKPHNANYLKNFNNTSDGGSSAIPDSANLQAELQSGTSPFAAAGSSANNLNVINDITPIPYAQSPVFSAYKTTSEILPDNPDAAPTYTAFPVGGSDPGSSYGGFPADVPASYNGFPTDSVSAAPPPANTLAGHNYYGREPLASSEENSAFVSATGSNPGYGGDASTYSGQTGISSAPIPLVDPPITLPPATAADTPAGGIASLNPSGVADATTPLPRHYGNYDQ